MAVIVAFGDSNTWGYDPARGTRFAPDRRWTGIMARELGPDHRVIEEGLNGRTTVFLDPIEPDRRGSDYLAPCLRSHAPLDLLIISLGCNDMKARFNVGAGDIASGAERLVTLAEAEKVGPNGGVPMILLVSPPARYREVAERRGIGFVDAGQFIRCSDLDGIHYEADQHAILGATLAEAARMMLD
jgi:lysophospholipase L1-like esterase